MSNEFNALRARARDKRDRAIAEIRSEYAAQLVAIAALEALDPRRAWRKRSIDNHFSRLRERGLIRPE